MNVLAILVGLVCCSGCFGATFYRCFWINSPTVICDNFSPDPTCGTNLVTYKNKCEFSRAHCADKSIDLKHNGACTAADGTTPAPVNAAGSDVVFDFLCTSLSHMDCPADDDKVCADDGYTYRNYCEFEKQKCTHRDLQLVACTV
ncbi:ovomucoid-like [Ruditapes philippinarum]|uniref:ovomucoid-like n=1 Tax=Ruditapes philippinarum TaxID=129788 RepID=UPI00295B4775|nr:ovomucoid-like [Ruditapes philippinarum]